MYHTHYAICAMHWIPYVHAIFDTQHSKLPLRSPKGITILGSLCNLTYMAHTIRLNIERKIHLEERMLYYTPLLYTTLHYFTLLCTTLHYTALYCTVLHYTTRALDYTILHYVSSYYTMLHYTTLHYIIPHHSTLHYDTLY